MAFSINSAYAHIPNGSANKIYVPVSSSSLLYSHFDHVQGFQAKKGQNGVSISKIQILNTLIDHLSSIKAGSAKPAIKNTSDEELDALIKNYQTQISQTVKMAQNTPYILAGNKPEAGVLLSMEA
ncbi:MAG: hypothetical protein K6E78_04120 [Treponema sp.]|nr:hypothetical protein [Treponema sp.]